MENDYTVVYLKSSRFLLNHLEIDVQIWIFPCKTFQRMKSLHITGLYHIKFCYYYDETDAELFT